MITSRLIAIALATTTIAATDGWRVGQADVRIVCPLTVGGSFEAKTASLAGTVTPTAPGSPMSGQLVVDLSTLDTGIDLRNDHLRNKYLEAGRGEGFKMAVLSDITLAAVDPQTFQGRTTFTGTLALHGTKKSITGQAEIRRSASSVRVSATFPVTLTDFGIAKPRYLGVGIKNQVQAKVTFDAAPAAGSSE